MSAILVLLVAFLHSAAFSKEITIDNGSATFVVPDDFTNLSEDEIGAKFPAASAPNYVVGNQRRTTTIAYQLLEQPVKASDLPEVKEAFTQVFNRAINGIEWKQNALVDLVGQKWLLLEMTSKAIDQDIHNIMLVTSHNGKMLLFNFNSTKKEFPEVEKILKDSINSIVLKRQ